MPHQPNTAGSAERDLIESMLDRQETVLSELDLLFEKIEGVIEGINQERKAEAEAEIEDSVLSLEFPNLKNSDEQSKRAA